MSSSGERDRRVLIIVPTYNELDNIEPLLARVQDELPRANVLVVDDNSPDGTGEVADRWSAADDRIAVLHRRRKLGLGKAYVAGFRYGLQRGYEYFFEMDADLSHDPRYLGPMLERARGGADLVIGSRYTRDGGTANWGFGRQLISRGGNLYARGVLGVGVSDLTSGFKCIRRRLLEAIDLDSVRSEGYSFQVEMTYRALRGGFSVEEHPIIFVDRRVGQSKMSRKIVAEAVWMVWRLRLGLIK